MTSQNETVTSRLRQVTQQEQKRLEALPFFRALLDGNLPLLSYGGWLRALSLVYETFEHAMLSARQPMHASVWDSSLSMLALIDRDLGSLQRFSLVQTPVAVVRANLLAQAIRTRAYDDPLSLVGFLYVLQQPPLAEIRLVPHLERMVQVSDAQGLAYISALEAESTQRSVVTQINQLHLDEAELDRAALAALEAIKGMGRVIEALYPDAASTPYDLARELNRAAGSHAITTNPRELAAALHAGEQSWREFPYYQWRYGERGTQFTRSDSAWLVTLADFPQPVVDQQVGWLGRVLASRGMPQWMLERHLNVLYEELVTAVPERQEAYTRLHHAAERLRERRQRFLDDDMLEAHIAAFDRRVGSEWSMKLPRTGGLLAAAVADEQLGIAQAVSSIELWMIDPGRFPDEWSKAVQATIREARAQSTGPKP